MLAIRAESASVVSMPPREKRIAKRRARAAKLGLGLPPSVMGKSSVKQTQKGVKPPVPTLAALRKRLHRPPTPEPASPVAYLPGQEDIPRSDNEFDNRDRTTANIHHVAPPTHHITPAGASHLTEHNFDDHFDVAAEDDNLLDYDAEGEDDDEQVDTEMEMDLDATQPLNLLANASEDDVRALFSGFDNLRFDEGPVPLDNSGYFSGNFDTFDPPTAHMWEVATRSSGSGSSSTVQDLGTYSYTRDSSVPNVASYATQPSIGSGPSHLTPPPAVESPPHPPLPPLRRVPTPAPWVMTPEAQIPTPIRSPPVVRTPTPCPQPAPLPPVCQATPQNSASRAGAGPLCWPSSSTFGSPVFARPRPRPSTSERASRICGEAGPSRSHHLPPAPAPALPSGGLDLTELESDSDPNPPRCSTPVRYEDTDWGLTEDSVLPAHLTQARCRAA
ncbi:hypothetical protein FRC07_012067 [Ceratobasidium sp. 392]|nr:hypothetical protein FRC07_012067 [Ceratobasidium sp. 392]